MERPEVSAIIVSFGHGATLGRTVSSLQLLGDNLCEAIVVDNAGDLGETRLGRAGGVLPELFDPGENLGFSAAVNRVAGRARGGLLLLLSPDAEVVSWDGGRIRAELGRGAGAIGALTLDHDDRPAHSWGEFPGLRALVRRLLGRRSGDRRRVFASLADGVPADVDWVLGAALVLPRSAFDAVGGLDESYFSSGEDQDLGARMARIGLRTVVSPAWVVRHEPRDPADLRAEIRRNNRCFVARHGSVVDRFAWFLTRFPDALVSRKRNPLRDDG